MLKFGLAEMFKIIYVVIFVFVDLLSVADILRAKGCNVEPLELGTSGTIPCGHVENVTEIRLVQWYKSRSIDKFVNSVHSLAWWREGDTGSQPNYHMENTTFSLVIDKATLTDEGLYKCSVVREDLSTGSNYFTRTVTYALPRMDPKITLDTDLNRVHCTVEHVKPVIYPMLNFDWIPDSTETYVVLNENGTYTTSVCCALPKTKSASRVECSFFYSNYRRNASLDLPDITTDSLMENKRTTVSPIGTSVTFAGDGCRIPNHTVNLAWGILVGLVIAAATFAILIWLKRNKRHLGEQECKRVKENEEETCQPRGDGSGDLIMCCIV